MIASDKNLLPLSTTKNLSRLFCLEKGNITEDINCVTASYSFIPILDYLFCHIFNRFIWPSIWIIPKNIFVTEMYVTCKKCFFHISIFFIKLNTKKYKRIN